ncbi:MAG: phosphoribosylformylglycinamidine synthase subunit PurQ [Bacteroidetes bacterium]|nr:phosphoribosylformylglycinamidine synthase subunit PurQ [Bacteroidota bacterium]
MKFGVVIFPGSNCDEDMIYVLGNIMKQEVVRLWHKEGDLKGCDFVVLPGGFSYGDYLRAGALARYSPIMSKVIEFANRGGYVFGVCNGFQILCEANLLPGALLRNERQKFTCKNVHLVSRTPDTLLTSLIPPGKALKIPVAHGEGRFYADAKTIRNIKKNGCVLFSYCDEAGNITPASNPNGSLENIAGICNWQKNVFGMMPHPERASDEMLGNTDGRLLFESVLQSMVEAGR